MRVCVRVCACVRVCVRASELLCGGVERARVNGGRVQADEAVAMGTPRACTTL